MKYKISFIHQEKTTYKSEILSVLTKDFSNTSINLLACIVGEKNKRQFPCIKKKPQNPRAILSAKLKLLRVKPGIFRNCSKWHWYDKDQETATNFFKGCFN